MIIRVRTNIGVWRVDNLEASATTQDVLDGIAATRPHVVYEKVSYAM
jgi:nuclear protein localization family protein 4